MIGFEKRGTKNGSCHFAVDARRTVFSYSESNRQQFFQNFYVAFLGVRSKLLITNVGNNVMDCLNSYKKTM